MKNIVVVLASFVICQVAQALSPTPDGGYPGQNTAEGQNALFSLTTGTFNTGVGWLSLKNNASANFNTATGAGALFATSADGNTATGAGALFSNTEGESNTANGAFALFNNTDHGFNTATGFEALFTNRTGQNNTATGAQALFSNNGDPTNNEGSSNSAFGSYALYSNTTGYGNSAFGWGAMPSNNSGSFNTASGFQALGQAVNTGDGAVATGNYNTAVGERALGAVTTGSYNATLGAEAGSEVDTSNNVICIGAGVSGISSVVGEMDDSCYIGNIYNAPVDFTTALPVLVDQDGKLGTQGFDAKKIAASHLSAIHPRRTLKESGSDDCKIDEQQTRITSLESNVATQQAKIEQQQKQMDGLALQLKKQATAIELLTTRMKINGPSAKIVVYKP